MKISAANVSQTLAMRFGPLVRSESQRKAAHDLHIGVAIHLAVFNGNHANEHAVIIKNAAARVAEPSVEVIQRPLTVLLDAIACDIAVAILVSERARVANNENLGALPWLSPNDGVMIKRGIHHDNRVVSAIQNQTLDRDRLAIDCQCFGMG